MSKKSGIIAYVYRNKLGACGGISDRVDEIVIVGEGIDEVFEETATRPAFELVQHVRGCVSLVPVAGAPSNKHLGPMFGGNYANPGDSRVTRRIEKLLGHPFHGAIAIHDRYETQVQYDRLSQ